MLKQKSKQKKKKEKEENIEYNKFPFCLSIDQTPKFIIPTSIFQLCAVNFDAKRKKYDGVHEVATRIYI